MKTHKFFHTLADSLRVLLPLSMSLAVLTGAYFALSEIGSAEAREAEAQRPANLSAEVADGELALTWEPPQAGADSLSGYEVLRRRADLEEDALLPIARLDGVSLTTFIDPTAEEGALYVYRVRAMRGDEPGGTSDFAKIDTSGAHLDGVPPAAIDFPPLPPRGESDNVSLQDSDLTFSWTRDMDTAPPQALFMTEDRVYIGSDDENGTALIHALDRSDYSYIAGELITGVAAHTVINDMWSDGTTIWTIDSFDDKIYAYDISGKSRDTSKEFNLHSDNNHPTGIWSDGHHVWIGDDDDNKFYAYILKPESGETRGARVTAEDIDAPSGTREVGDFFVIDGVLWLLQRATSRNTWLYAIDSENGNRLRYLDFRVGSDLVADSLFVDDTHIWVGMITDDGTAVQRAVAFHRRSLGVLDDNKSWDTISGQDFDSLWMSATRAYLGATSTIYVFDRANDYARVERQRTSTSWSI